MMITDNDPNCVDRVATRGLAHNHYYYTFTGIDRKTGRAIEGAFVSTYLGPFGIANETRILLNTYETPVIQNFLPISCLQYSEYVVMLNNLAVKTAVKQKKHLKVLPLPLPSKNVINDVTEGEGDNANV